jgi:hypothetical protein
MDERRQPLLHHDTCKRIGTDAAPVVVDVRRDEQRVVPGGQIDPLSAEPSRENSQTVFYGDEQLVREGFALALRAMGLDADFLPVGIALYLSLSQIKSEHRGDEVHPGLVGS